MFPIRICTHDKFPSFFPILRQLFKSSTVKIYNSVVNVWENLHVKFTRFSAQFNRKCYRFSEIYAKSCSFHLKILDFSFITSKIFADFESNLTNYCCKNKKKLWINCSKLLSHSNTLKKNRRYVIYFCTCWKIIRFYLGSAVDKSTLNIFLIFIQYDFMQIYMRMTVRISLRYGSKTFFYFKFIYTDILPFIFYSNNLKKKYAKRNRYMWTFMHELKVLNKNFVKFSYLQLNLLGAPH